MKAKIAEKSAGGTFDPEVVMPRWIKVGALSLDRAEKSRIDTMDRRGASAGSWQSAAALSSLQFFQAILRRSSLGLHAHWRSLQVFPISRARVIRTAERLPLENTLRRTYDPGTGFVVPPEVEAGD